MDPERVGGAEARQSLDVGPPAFVGGGGGRSRLGPGIRWTGARGPLVACSSTGRSGQLLPEQRETDAAGAARVAGGGLRDPGPASGGGCGSSSSPLLPGVAVAGVRSTPGVRLVSEAGSELQVLVAGAVQVTRCAAVVAAYGSSSEQSLQEQREADLAGAARVAGGGCGISFMWRLQEQLESLAVGVQICVRQSGQWLLEQRASGAARNEGRGLQD